MGADFQFRMVTTYPSLPEANVVMGLLEAEGIRCRIDDVDLPGLVGHFGSMGRSTAIYVLESDLERAAALISELAKREALVDEAELAVEAESAASGAEAASEHEAAAHPPSLRPPKSRTRGARAPLAVTLVAAALVVGALLILVRACG